MTPHRSKDSGLLVDLARAAAALPAVRLQLAQERHDQFDRRPDDRPGSALAYDASPENPFGTVPPVLVMLGIVWLVLFLTGWILSSAVLGLAAIILGTRARKHLD